MADVDIAVDSGDLKAAIDLLNEYGMSFTQMVNKVQTEGNRLNRASKASADQFEEAWRRAQEQIGRQTNQVATDFRKLEREISRGSAVISRSAKEFFNTPVNQKSGLSAASTLLAEQLQQDVEREAAALKLREQQWKQFFSQDFMKSPSAGANGAPTSAKNSAFADQLHNEEQAARQAAQAAAELAKEKQRLTASYNPLLAAEQKYLQTQAEINRAAQLGIITTKQQEAALGQLQREYQALGSGVYIAGSRFNQFGEMADGAGKSANRIGLYAQQAGYQFGDMAVQIQSGTNAGVAFSQQMAQLAGLIPGVVGALTTFAAIGVGLLIQNLTRGKEEAKKTFAELERFEELEAIFKSVGASFKDSMSKSIQEVRKEYGDFVADVARSRLNRELDQLKDNLNVAMTKATPVNPDAKTGFFGQLLNAGRQSGTPSQNGLTQEFIEAQKQAQDYNMLLQLVQNEQDKLFNGSINTKSELVEAYRNFYDNLSRIPGISNDILLNIQKVGEETGIWSENVSNAGEKFEETSKKLDEARQYYLDQKREIQDIVNLETIRLKYGSDSVQYLDAQKASLLIAYGLELDKLDLNKQQVAALMDLKAQQIDIEQSVERNTLLLDDMLDILLDIAGVDIASVFSRAQATANALLGTVNAIGRGMSQLGRLAMETQALQAERAALAEGKSPGESKVAGDVVRYGQSLPQGGGLVGDLYRGMSKKAYEMAQLEQLGYREEIAEDTKAWNDANKPKKGGKGKKPKKSDAEKDAEKAAEKFNEFLDQFEIHMEQQERLSGVFGEQREELEKVIEIENRLGNARHLASQEQIEAWAAEELALERKLEREQTLYEIGSQNFENLLMTVVNGTGSIEDAFRSMLANMISELYQNFVGKHAASAVGGWFSALLSANGNAFNSAGQVQYFANGGVVSAPTAFRHAGGLGVMGEAGPEAIMPLKRNSQGKLGVEVSGGKTGDVNITQVFQLQAAGDESVKQIIRQESPKIAEQAKNAVIAAKRRGEKGLR